MSGKMRHSMTIYRESSAAGADDRSWTKWRSKVPCNFVPVGGMESYRGKQLEATVSHVIETRFFPGFVPTMKIVDDFDSQEFQIKGVIERDGRRDYLDIHATEVVA